MSDDERKAVAKLAGFVSDLLTWARDETVANQHFPVAAEWRAKRDEARKIAAQFQPQTKEPTD